MRLRLLLALGLLAGGVALAGYGLWLIYEPAAWILAGFGLLAAGLLVELDPKPRRRPPGTEIVER